MARNYSALKQTRKCVGEAKIIKNVCMNVTNSTKVFSIFIIYIYLNFYWACCALMCCGWKISILPQLYIYITYVFINNKLSLDARYVEHFIAIEMKAKSLHGW